MPEAHQGEDEPHDVLAADEFAIPGQEPGVPHDTAPDAHDVLAAEEFAFPAGGEPLDGTAAHRRPSLWLAVGLMLGLALLARRRRS